MFGQTLIHIDGFGRNMRWTVMDVRQFGNVTIVDAKPEWLVDANGSDIPEITLSKGRTVSAKVTGPVEKFQFLN
jgi:hypothetical protein